VFVKQTPAWSRLLHVLNGDCTAERLRQSTVPGTFTVWADVLHDGPVQRDVDADRWRETRARFLSESGYAAFEEARRKYAEWDRGLEEFPEYDEVVLWLEHDLFDQLLLIRHLDWFARRHMGETALSLICIDRYPGVEPFHGLGQLSPDQLATLLDTRQRVTFRQVELARAAWEAFTAPEPNGLPRILERDTSALPFLAGALRRHLEEYPSVRNGLARTERQILEATVNGPMTPLELFGATQRREERVFMGDSSFWRRVLDLAGGRHRLLALEVEAADQRLPNGVVRITELGREMLDGRVDAVDLNGIDRWLGGVHLHGREVPWRWDETAGRLSVTGRAR
jgi:hypothetical protein